MGEAAGEAKMGEAAGASKMDKKKFRVELNALIGRAKAQGRTHVEVNAGDLHRVVGGFPPQGDEKSEIGTCCAVMRSEADKGDAEVVHQSTAGAGPALTIRYAIPRPPKTEADKDGEPSAT